MGKKVEKHQERPSAQKEATLAQQFGMFGLVFSSFAISSALGVGLGWVLWKRAGFPWWTIILTAFLALFGSSYQIYRYQKTIEEKGDRS